MSEHWATQEIKREVIQAMVAYSNGEGMSVSARVATDNILDILNSKSRGSIKHSYTAEGKNFID